MFITETRGKKLYKEAEMKKLRITLGALLVLMLLSVSTFAKNPVSNSVQIVDNLTKGLRSDNSGLRVSSAFVLSQLVENKIINREDVGRAIIPLMKMLRENNTDEAKIVSAIALHHIGTAMGIYSVRGAAVLDKSERVRSLCKNLYCDYHIKNDTPYFCSTLAK